MEDSRSLSDLRSVGPATLRDLHRLEIHSIHQLADADPEELYQRLCEVTGERHDPCCLDVFCCAVAQARDPELPPEQMNWWYWSQIRKQRGNH